MRGEKITSLDQLYRAAKDKKCVIGNAVWCLNRIPAAFVINMTGSVIHIGIKMGLYIYNGKEKS